MYEALKKHLLTAEIVPCKLLQFSYRTGKILNLTIVNAEGERFWISGEGSGLRSVLNLDKEHSKLYFGGIPDWFHPPVAFESTTFDGQFEDVTVNGEQIGLWNFVDIVVPEGTSTIGAISGAKGRDKLKINETSTACRFGGDAYIKLPAGFYSDAEHTDILMSFKTTVPDGLLYLSFKEQQFITLEMRSGFVYFRVSDR